ncbi:MAG: Hsp20/alpha crystallin family protein [Acidobacteria bacterium]|nr:Hsp20/alpha crystallin family protein [Acidobacteriota bacterium]
MAKAKETQETVRSDESRQRESALAQPRTGELSRDFGGFRYASPFSFMRRFSEEMDRLFENAWFGNSWLGRPFVQRNELGSFAWSPQIETFQRNNEFVLRAELPGLNKDDLKVSVEDNCLTIQGERKKEWTSDQESAGGYRSERSYGSFYRCIQLPQGVQAENVSATFRDGVLEIKMPIPEQKQARRVEIAA